MAAQKRIRVLHSPTLWTAAVLALCLAAGGGKCGGQQNQQSGDSDGGGKPAVGKITKPIKPPPKPTPPPRPKPPPPPPPSKPPQSSESASQPQSSKSETEGQHTGRSGPSEMEREPEGQVPPAQRGPDTEAKQVYGMTIPAIPAGNWVSGSGQRTDMTLASGRLSPRSPMSMSGGGSSSINELGRGADPAARSLTMGKFGAQRTAAANKAGEAGPGMSEKEAQLRSRDLVQKGSSLLKMGDAEGALSLANQAIRFDPKNPQAWVLKAKSLNRLRRWAEAEEAAWESIRVGGESVEAYQELGWAQLHQGKHKDALAALNRAVFLDPNNADSYAMRALIHEAMGNREKMIADLEAAARLDPKYLEHLRRARNGEKLFDPNAKDTWKLLEGLEGPVSGGSRSLALGLAIMLFGVFAGLAGLFRKRIAKFLARLGGEARIGSPGAVLDIPPSEAEALAVGKPSAFSEPAKPEAEGDVIAGKYVLRRKLGSSPRGQLWKAKDSTLGRKVVVRKIDAAAGDLFKMRDACRKEAQSLAELRHPNIVDLFEVVDVPGGLCLVFEHVEGAPLREILQKRGRVPVRQCRQILKGVCSALKFAHEKGIVHRNVKPSNIVINESGYIKISDFALSVANGADGPYSAPELKAGRSCPSTDVFALGICLYQMLTGEFPAGSPGDPEWGSVPADQREAVSAELQSLLHRSLDADPEKRLQTPREFADLLEKA